MIRSGDCHKHVTGESGPCWHSTPGGPGLSLRCRRETPSRKHRKTLGSVIWLAATLLVLADIADVPSASSTAFCCQHADWPGSRPWHQPGAGTGRSRACDSIGTQAGHAHDTSAPRSRVCTIKAPGPRARRDKPTPVTEPVQLPPGETVTEAGFRAATTVAG